MDSVSNGPVESSAESPAPVAEADEEAVPKSSPAVAAAKGRGLRRWRRIRREQEQQREGCAAAAAAAAGGGGGSAGDEEYAQLHKRRLPLAAGAPKGKKHDAPAVEAESSTASVESRFVPPGKLDLGLGLLIAPAGFSVGAGGGGESDSSEGRSSKSSTAASAPRVLPRHGHALLFQRERDRVSRPRVPGGASPHARNPRASRSRVDTPRVAYSAAVSTEADNSRSSDESDLRSLNAWQSGPRLRLSGVDKIFPDHCDHGDEEQPNQEIRSTGYCKENGSSMVGRSVQMSADSGDGVEDTFEEGSVGKGQNGRMHFGADYYNESTLSLQITQEALENEIEKIMAIGKEATDDFHVHDDEWSGSDHLEEPIDEVNERIKNLESRLEQESALIKEKASRIHELEATAIENTNLLLSQSELDQLYQEKMEADIRCTIQTRAYQASVSLPEDEDLMALYEAQKSLSEDYKQLALKLQHTENRAMVLEEMAEKLQVQCKELSNCSEVLELQYKASRVSLFCLVQFILLFIAIGTYLMRLSPSSSEVVLVPT